MKTITSLVKILEKIFAKKDYYILLHREVRVWVYNKKAEILFQKRSITKDAYPGLLDASVDGPVGLNDNYNKAAIRELKEETGIPV